jgi:hypothetical protein
LKKEDVYLAKLCIPVTIPIAIFFFTFFRVFNFTLLQVVVQLLYGFALEKLQEFFDEINNPVCDSP